MKYFIIFLNIVAIALIIYNTTKLDFNNITQGESFISLITIISALCAILLLQILRVSKRIQKKVNQ